MKISINKKIFGYSLLAALLVSCSDGTFSDSVPTEEDGEITVVLRIPVDGDRAESRANPLGAENGNGRENGLEN